jgi:uncharacterized protein YjbI with pentapeptide repeats
MDPLTRAEVEQLLAQKKTKKGLKRADLTEVKLRKPTPLDFSGAFLDETDLGGLDFTGLALRGATLKWCRTVGTRFARADFTGATIIGMLFRASAAGACFVGAQLKALDATDASLAGADFTNANLVGAELGDSDLTGASFRGANLVGVDFSCAKLGKADFTGAKLGRNNFKGAKTKGAIGLDRDGDDDDDTLFQRITPEGVWIIAIPKEHAAAWKGGNAPEGIEGKVTVASYIEMGSLAVGPKGASRALVFEGEYDTGFLPTADGGVFIRGGDFLEVAEAEKLVAKAAKRKGWKRHAHAITVGKSGLALFDSAYKAAKTDVIDVPLAKGTYAVDVLGASDGDGSAMSYVRLTKA